MPNQQKYRPISFRPREADRLWLADYAERTGRPVNAILAEALREYRDARSSQVKISGENPEQEYRDALAEHGRALTEVERTQRMVDRARAAYTAWLLEYVTPLGT